MSVPRTLVHLASEQIAGKVVLRPRSSLLEQGAKRLVDQTLDLSTIVHRRGPSESMRIPNELVATVDIQAQHPEKDRGRKEERKIRHKIARPRIKKSLNDLDTPTSDFRREFVDPRWRERRIEKLSILAMRGRIYFSWNQREINRAGRLRSPLAREM
jgi:hypothetical protein